MSDCIGAKALAESIVWNNYSRPKADGTRETWEEIIARTMNMHIAKYPFLETELRHIFKKYVQPRRLCPSGRSLRYAGAALERNNVMMYNWSLQF